MAHSQHETDAVKFHFTMNMMSRNGNPTHLIMGSVDDVDTIDDLLERLQCSEFIKVTEFYRGTDGKPFSKGHIILNTMHIGKVKPAVD